MALVITNQGEVIALKALLNHTAPQNLILRLYSNNKTPAETDVASDYTEVSGHGYAAVTLTGSSWSFTGGNPTVAVYPECFFNFSGAAGAVYGYYVTQATSGVLVYAERFTTAPQTIVSNGDAIRITPRITGE